MDDLRFKSLEELYKKLLPAFNVKVNELRRNNINNIKSEDLWRFFKDNNWGKRNNLSLCEMVDDILNTSSNEIVDYLLSDRNE